MCHTVAHASPAASPPPVPSDMSSKSISPVSSSPTPSVVVGAFSYPLRSPSLISMSGRLSPSSLPLSGTLLKTRTADSFVLIVANSPVHVPLFSSVTSVGSRTTSPSRASFRIRAEHRHFTGSSRESSLPVPPQILNITFSHLGTSLLPVDVVLLRRWILPPSSDANCPRNRNGFEVCLPSTVFLVSERRIRSAIHSARWASPLPSVSPSCSIDACANMSARAASLVLLLDPSSLSSRPRASTTFMSIAARMSLHSLILSPRPLSLLFLFHASSPPCSVISSFHAFSQRSSTGVLSTPPSLARSSHVSTDSTMTLRRLVTMLSTPIPPSASGTNIAAVLCVPPPTHLDRPAFFATALPMRSSASRQHASLIPVACARYCTRPPT